METLPLLGIQIFFVVKIFVLLALLIYIIFALVVLRQSGLMAETVDLGFDTVVRMVAIGHLLFAIGTFILALIIL